MSHYDNLREKDAQTAKRPAVKKAKKKVNKGGRPRIDIDYKKLDAMCAIQCTGEECAAILGVSYEHLNNTLKRDGNGGFLDYFKLKSANGKMSLRRKQYDLASSGNATMLIWLGKQWLGQAEKQEVKHEEVFTNIMPVPVADSIESWEESAQKQQDGILKSAGE